MCVCFGDAVRVVGGWERSPSLPPPPLFVVRGECSLGATILFPSRFSSNLFCECVCSCLFVCVGVHECVYIFGVMGRGMLGEDDGGKHVMQFITYLSSLIGDRNVHPP